MPAMFDQIHVFTFKMLTKSGELVQWLSHLCSQRAVITQSSKRVQASCEASSNQLRLYNPRLQHTRDMAQKLNILGILFLNMIFLYIQSHLYSKLSMVTSKPQPSSLQILLHSEPNSSRSRLCITSMDRLFPGRVD
jgi:hypothetical protein